MPNNFRALTLLTALLLLGCAGNAWAVSFSNFSEAGQTVNGYQDDFLGSVLNPDWLPLTGLNQEPIFQLTGNGTLLISANPPEGNPNKLLYNPASGYNQSNQEILALIRATPDSTGTMRGGITALGDTADAGKGFNLVFVSPQIYTDNTRDHHALLNDYIAWGPAIPGTEPSWTNGQWKWLRLKVDNNFVSGGTLILGKVWDAGNTPEPALWSVAWTAPSRAGVAGFDANVSLGTGRLEAAYVLIKATGLPQINTIANVAVPSNASVPGDFDGDGDVDGADFVAWQANFPKPNGATLAQGDADGDGDVDGADFVVWQANFPFTSGAGTAPVPEPTAAILIALGLFALGLRRPSRDFA